MKDIVETAMSKVQEKLQKEKKAELTAIKRGGKDSERLYLSLRIYEFSWYWKYHVSVFYIPSQMNSSRDSEYEQVSFHDYDKARQYFDRLVEKYELTRI